MNISEEKRQIPLKAAEKDELKGRVKRRSNRKAAFVIVNYAAQRRFYQDFIRNISDSGVFIETSIPFSVGQEVSMSFPLPGQLEGSLCLLLNLPGC